MRKHVFNLDNYLKLYIYNTVKSEIKITMQREYNFMYKMIMYILMKNATHFMINDVVDTFLVASKLSNIVNLYSVIIPQWNKL